VCVWFYDCCIVVRVCHLGRFAMPTTKSDTAGSAFVSLSASPLLSPGVSGLVGRLRQLFVLCWLRNDILWRYVGIHWPWCPVSWTKWTKSKSRKVHMWSLVQKMLPINRSTKFHRNQYKCEETQCVWNSLEVVCCSPLGMVKLPFTPIYAAVAS
jgi:hypothetical protein